MILVVELAVVPVLENNMAPTTPPESWIAISIAVS
jgi:hypothetical protein